MLQVLVAVFFYVKQQLLILLKDVKEMLLAEVPDALDLLKKNLN